MLLYLNPQITQKMKKESISTADKLFIACQLTDLFGQSPNAVTTDGDAILFHLKHGDTIMNFEKRQLTIDGFTWQEEILDALLSWTAKHGLDLILQLPSGEYNIFAYQK